VDLQAGTLTVVNAKTASGNRTLPIHTQLQGTVERLVRTSQDGFVFSGLRANKYGDRSTVFVARFRMLKKRAGFSRAGGAGPENVLHSIRRTVATLLKRAGVPEGVAADILGYERRGATMSFGLYSAGSSMQQKRQAIEKLTYPL
jgi:integrase